MTSAEPPSLARAKVPWATLRPQPVPLGWLLHLQVRRGTQGSLPCPLPLLSEEESGWSRTGAWVHCGDLLTQSHLSSQPQPQGWPEEGTNLWCRLPHVSWATCSRAPGDPKELQGRWGCQGAEPGPGMPCLCASLCASEYQVLGPQLVWQMPVDTQAPVPDASRSSGAIRCSAVGERVGGRK